MANVIQQFQGIMLPGYSQLILPAVRNDIGRILNDLYLHKDNLAAVNDGISSLERTVFVDERLVENAKPTINAWVDAALAIIQDNVPAAGGAGYANNTLYIVTVPEFGFNTYEDGGVKGAGALYPLPEELEGYIADRIHEGLRARFAHVRIVFAFSCCSYSTRVRTVTLNGNTQYRLSGVSRITVLTSTSTPAKQITKLSSAHNDRWFKTLENEFLFIDGRAYLSLPGRPGEVRFDLDCFGDGTVGPDGRPAVIAFGTCQDGAQDLTHGTVNLNVFLSSGHPFNGLGDWTHPFLLNDLQAWGEGTKASALWRAGWYTFSSIGGGPNLQNNLERLWTYYNSQVPINNAGKSCYLHTDASVPHDVAGANPVIPKYVTTSAIAFPHAVPDNAGECPQPEGLPVYRERAGGAPPRAPAAPLGCNIL